MRRYLKGAVIFYLLLFSLSAAADEKKQIDLARSLYKAGEFHHAVTEVMRYRYLYPGGRFAAESLFVEGMSYLKGSNYDAASLALGKCSMLYRATPEGEEALFYLGYMRLRAGSPLYAMRSFKQYLLRYEDSRFTEKVHYYRVFNAAMMGDLPGARQMILTYRHLYPQGAYGENLQQVDSSILAEVNRPRKSMVLALTGSIILPGFGHFYTGNYRTGFLSLLANAVFISLTVHGVMHNNPYQWGLFGFIELQFYLYSLYGAMRDVNAYNSSTSFYRGLRLMMQQEF